jgi:hypothetical protein
MHVVDKRAHSAQLDRLMLAIEKSKPDLFPAI